MYVPFLYNKTDETDTRQNDLLEEALRDLLKKYEKQEKKPPK